MGKAFIFGMAGLISLGLLLGLFVVLRVGIRLLFGKREKSAE